MKKPTYLGDGVYAQYDEYGDLTLTTGEPGLLGATNIIYLDPGVLAALLNYIKPE